MTQGVERGHKTLAMGSRLSPSQGPTGESGAVVTPLAVNFH